MTMIIMTGADTVSAKNCANYLQATRDNFVQLEFNKNMLFAVTQEHVKKTTKLNTILLGDATPDELANARTMGVAIWHFVKPDTPSHACANDRVMCADVTDLQTMMETLDKWLDATESYA